MTDKEQEEVENFLKNKTFICNRLEDTHGRMSPHMCRILCAIAYQRYQYANHIFSKLYLWKKGGNSTINMKAHMDLAYAKDCMECPRFIKPNKYYTKIVDSRIGKKPKYGPSKRQYQEEEKKKRQSDISTTSSIQVIVAGLHDRAKKIVAQVDDGVGRVFPNAGE
jgi:hypothetical protein